MPIVANLREIYHRDPLRARLRLGMIRMPDSARWIDSHGRFVYTRYTVSEIATPEHRRDSMLLSDHIALVTGAGQGIGRAAALALAQEGAEVAVADMNGQKAEETGSAILALGRRGLALQADVGNVQDIDRMVRQTIDTFGRIDILVNNAGVTRRAYLMDLTEEDWGRIHRVNAKGVFFCLQRAAREMIPNQG